MLATAGTNAGPELIHRAKNSIQQKVGYWLLALNFDTAFVIEHLHGHHKFVGTYDDPATARYNENTGRTKSKQGITIKTNKNNGRKFSER